ncbi:hypothetical protein J2X68_005070 [Streptomyces sp. 3330]|uniref:hypothetical protein n=1 Tax=Streptomyces sp. 3330 TaxID=2817755 RepID=UPI0028597E2E|nr:hypothetical protein [Streptomyces sp. 3330]MDR6978344.1 hypothetical protein [Streptomyces sp. 3330]
MHMPWDELKQALTAQKATFTQTDPVWTVAGANGESFRAHPAFLDEVRAAGGLPDLLTATDRTLAGALGRWRVTLDRHLTGVPEARTALGLADHRFTALDEQITLLRYHETARSQPGAANPVIAAAGTAFADRRQAATVHDFTQLHAFFLAAVNSFGGAYDAHTYPGRVDAMYALAVGSPAAASAGPVRLGTVTDWQTHQPGFAVSVHAAAARLNFRTPDALAGHALKHVLRTSPQIPGDQAGVHGLIATYLQEARDKVTATSTATVTSALAQTGATRTYYFGVVNDHATMVAVNSSGDAWISTYYAPTRL